MLKLPVFRCKFCTPHRWYMTHPDGRKIFIEPQAVVPSDGICDPCLDKMRARSGLPPIERHALLEVSA